MKIKIFSDGADIASTLELIKNPMVKGITTNPSLMKKAGVKDYPSFAKEMLTAIPHLPISFEVFADDLPTMEKQAREIARWGKNVYVKIPVVNTQGESTLALVKKLSHEGVQLNITAIYSLDQVIGVCNAVKGGASTFVSVFAGRMADNGYDPVPLMQAALALCQNAGPKVELLWASTREVYNIVQAEQMGIPIITAPADVIKKLAAPQKTLEQHSIDTVKGFKADSDSAGFTM